MTTRRRSIAVIGSGVAGLTAAHELAKGDRITLFEADTRFGGHAHTHDVDGGNGEIVAVDTAFLVHNDRTYPTLCRLFAELGVATRDTDMSMSVRCDASGLEYAGARGFGGLFAHRGNLARPRYLAMLAEVSASTGARRALLDDADSRRPNRCGTSCDARASPVLHRALHDRRWSPRSGRARPPLRCGYPARYLFTFLDHHGMLSVFGSPHGAPSSAARRTYVERSREPARRGAHRDAGRGQCDRIADGVQVAAGRSAARRSTPSSSPPTPTRRWRCSPSRPPPSAPCSVRMPYSTNHALLHTDESVLPRTAGRGRPGTI